MAKRTKEGAAREKARKAAANRKMVKGSNGQRAKSEEAPEKWSGGGLCGVGGPHATADRRRPGELSLIGVEDDEDDEDGDLGSLESVSLSSPGHETVTLSGKQFDAATKKLAGQLGVRLGEDEDTRHGVAGYPKPSAQSPVPSASTPSPSDEIVLQVSTAIGGVCATDGQNGSVWILRDRHAEGGCLLAATNGFAAAVVPATMVGPRTLTSPDALAESVGRRREVLPDMLPRSMAKPDGQKPRVLKCVRGPDGTLFGSEPVWSDQEERRWEYLPPSQAMPRAYVDAFPRHTELTVHVEISAGMLVALAKAVNTPGIGDKVILSVTPGKSAVGVLGDVGAGVMLCEQPEWQHDRPRWDALMRRLGA